MNIPELAVKRSVTVYMIVVGLIVLGFVSLSRLAIDLLPDMNLPYAIVSVSYPGAAPEEVEKSVTKPLEEMLATINNVDKVQSQSSYGSSLIIMQFNWGTDMTDATQQMRDKVDQVRDQLPGGVKNPMVLKMDPSSLPVMTIGMSGGKDLADLTRLAEDKVKPGIERVPGAARVTVSGGSTNEVQVLVDPLKLSSYGLSLSQVAQALQAENTEVTAGTLKEGKKELTVKTTGEFQSVEELAGVPLTTSQGAVVYLRDVAQVGSGYADMDQYSYLNGKPCVSLSIQKQSGANTVEVAQGVRQQLEKLKKDLPASVRLEVVSDQSSFITEAINTVKESAELGGILAVLIIFLFLRNLRSTLVVAISIPISIITTFTLLYFKGVTLNMISLGGLALGVGLIVDDSIVVLESIYRHRQEGKTRLRAAIEGAQEVAMAVTASTLTNVIVFLPIIFVEGIAAQIFRDMAFAVAFSLLASLLVAMTLVPVLACRLIEANGNHRPRNWYQRLSARVGAVLDGIHGLYRELLVWALDHRKLVVLGVLGIFLVSLMMTPLVGTEFFPKSDSGDIAITLKMDKGTSLEETRKAAAQVAGICRSLPEVETVLNNVGSTSSYFSTSESSQASLQVKLIDRSQRRRSAEEVAAAISREAAGVAGADIEVQAQSGMSMGSSSPITINLQGDDLEVLKTVAGQMADIVKKVPGTANVKTSLETGSPEVVVRIDRDRAAAYGLTSGQVASALHTAIVGDVVTRYRSGGDDIDLRLRLQEGDRQSLDDLEHLLIYSSAGVAVPLREIAELSRDEAPTTIERENQTRLCTVTGDLRGGRPLGTVMQDIQQRLSTLKLPEGYSISYGGEQEQMTESFSALGMAFLLGILLVYMVMASQFESLFHPFVIMFTIPLAFIGVVWAFVITGKTFSIPAYIGVILLAGIVVKNGIVLIDYINQMRNRGMSRREAILKAGPVRLRPVLMTALAAILGMVPMAVGLGSGGETDQPLAIAVIGGLTVATFLTLVFVPVMYTVLEDLLARIKDWFRPLLPGGTRTRPGAGEGRACS